MHPGDDHLLDLAYRLLPEPEESALLLHLASCAPCEKRFRVCAGDIERLRAAADELLGAALGAARATAARPAADQADGFLRRLLRPRVGWGLGAAAAAAVCLVMLVTILHPRGPSTDGAALLTWLPAPGETVVTRDPTGRDAGAALREGLAAYTRHDAGAAVRALALAHDTGTMGDIAQIYYGSALAWTGDFAGAAQHLSMVKTEMLPEPWQGETRWTLYVALRESGQAERADSLLQTLASAGGEVGKRARRARENR
jgi:hypothetical protein